jgi:hypothetical protein
MVAAAGFSNLGAAPAFARSHTDLTVGNAVISSFSGWFPGHTSVLALGSANSCVTANSAVMSSFSSHALGPGCQPLSGNGCVTAGNGVLSTFSGCVPGHTSVLALGSTNSCVTANSAVMSSFSSTWVPPVQAPAREALHLVRVALAGVVDNNDVDKWRSRLLRSFQDWQVELEDTSDRHFWRLFNSFDEQQPLYKFATEQSWFTTISAASTLADARGDVTPWNSDSELSARRIGSILSDVIIQLKELEATADVDTVLSCIEETLNQRALKASLVPCQPSRRLKATRSGPSTHDWVLDFVIHTGNSPPALGERRSALRWAPTLSTDRTVEHETVYRCKDAASLRNRICNWNTGVRLTSRSQGNTVAAGRLRLAGCWGPRVHGPVAQCA